MFLWVFNSNIDIASAGGFKICSVSKTKHHKDSLHGKKIQKGSGQKEQLKCEPTIGSNEKIKLMNDLESCEADPVLTVTGPATLDFNGHTVSGNRNNDDTKLEGGAQSICYFVWGSGAGMNISYTFNLTPPEYQLHI